MFNTGAYNGATELARMVTPHSTRGEDEGRTLIAAGLEISGHELRVTLVPQSSPQRSRAIATLCADRKRLGAVAAGTDLRLVLDCAALEGESPPVRSVPLGAVEALREKTDDIFEQLFCHDSVPQRGVVV